MTVDISTTTAPKSDQVNYEDYIAGPRTHVIKEVRLVGGEQPVEIHLADVPGRPYKPSKTMRRLLVAAWGKDGNDYVGRRLTLFGNPDVKWAGQPVGGIQISHMSDIAKPLTLALTETKGKRAKHTVQPLAAAAPAPSIDVHLAAINATDSIDGLKQAWQDAAGAGLDKHPQILAATNQRKTELSEGAEQ